MPMSGHSKWSNIKHKKAAEDSKKGKIFTVLAKKIQIATKNGGSGDPIMNPSLRTILDEARSVNMPNENIKRAIERGLGNGEGTEIFEVVYEAYGPGGIGMMITAATDNKNRTGTEVKVALEKNGASMAGIGSVSYLKNLNPIPTVTLEGDDLERFEKIVESVEDLEDVTDVWSNQGS